MFIQDGGVASSRAVTLCIALVISSINTICLSGPPSWWISRGVIVEGFDISDTSEDRSAANIGQLLKLAHEAYEEMELQWALDGGSGSVVAEMVTTFEDVSVDELEDVVNIGQLKYIAKPFYDRLIERDLAERYPWIKGLPESENYALANIGQVKGVFAFDIPKITHADLQVAITSTQLDVYIEDDIVLTVTVVNNGSEYADNLIISNIFSEAFDYAYDLPTGWLQNGNVLIGKLKNLAANTSTSYVFSVSLDGSLASTELITEVTVSHAGVDSVSANNQAFYTNDIVPIPQFVCDDKYVYVDLTPEDFRESTNQCETVIYSGLDINEDGRLVFGVKESEINKIHYYGWENGKFVFEKEHTEAGFDDVYTKSIGLNDHGDVVLGNKAYRWLDGFYQEEEILTSGGWLKDINNNGTVIGWQDGAAVYGTPGNMENIVTGFISFWDLNNNDYAVGTMSHIAHYYYPNTKYTLSIGSKAYGMNDNGWVVGQVIDNIPIYDRPCVWASLSNSDPIFLETDNYDYTAGNSVSDINNSGKIIGNLSGMAAVWEDYEELPELLITKVGAYENIHLELDQLINAIAINEKDQIVCRSKLSAPNVAEGYHYLPGLLTPYCLDSDGDGILDGWEAENGFDIYDSSDIGADDDLDGIVNLREIVLGTDRYSWDTDGDYLSDYEEAFIFGTDPLKPDSDHDGIFDYDEIFLYDTDPNDADADQDGDGLLDWQEVLRGSFELVDTAVTWDQADEEALNAGGYLATLTSTNEWEIFQADIGTLNNSVYLGALDFFGDGDWFWVDADPWNYTRWATDEPNNNVSAAALQMDINGNWFAVDFTDLAAYIIEYDAQTLPYDYDTDYDGLVDGTNGKVSIDIYPSGADYDGDGFVDGEQDYGTDPLSEDTDNDYLDDAWEIYWGLDPLNGIGDHGADGDYDSDGLTNYEEYFWGTDPTSSDTDGDGYDDLWEIENYLDPLAGTTNNLVLWYKFDETSGTTINDASVNDHNGTLNNTTAGTMPIGISLGAQEFDGIDDNVSCSSASIPSLEIGFTISIWVNPELKGTDNPPKESLVILSDLFELRLNGRNPELIIADTTNDFNYPLFNQEWVNLVFTWDTQIVSLYADGDILLSTNLPVTLPQSIDLKIADNGNNAYYEGALDDLRIYGTALSLEDIRGNYEVGFDCDADGFSHASEYHHQTDPFNTEQFPRERGDLNADGYIDDADLAMLDNVLVTYQEEITRFYYDENGNVTNQIDALQNSTRMAYNKNNQPTLIIDPLNRETHTIYDERSRVHQTINALNATDTVYYNAYDNPIQTVDKAGNITKYTYNQIGQVVETIDSRLTKTRMIYDELHRQQKIIQAYGTLLQTETQFEYDQVDNVTAIINANNIRTEINYDSHSRKTNEIFAIGTLEEITHSYSYNARGEMISQTDARGNSITNTYDEMGRVTSTSDPYGNTQQNVYDSLGNLVKEIAPDGRTIRNEYDYLNRPVKIIDGNAVATTEYDVLNRPVASVNFRGVRTEVQYDAVGNTRFAIEAVGTSDQRITSLKYNKLNQVTNRINALGKKISHEYDALGRPTKTVDELNKVTKFKYEDGVNLTTVIKPDTTTIHHTYDALNRKIETHGGNDLIQKFTYDNLSRMTEAWDYNKPGLNTDDHKVEFTYNALDQQKTETQDGKTVEHEYDPNGNLIGITYPSALKATRVYNKNNQPTLISFASASASYEYTVNSQLKKITYGNGVIQNQTYNNRGQLKTLSQTGGNLNNNWSLKHDLNGNITSAIFNVSTTEKYQYDNLDQVTDYTENITQVFEAWHYDAMGNWKGYTDPNQAQTRTVNAVNQYEQVNGVNLYHDDNGNISSIPQEIFFSQSTLEFTYDWLNRLTEVHDGLNNLIATYTYDALNRRVTKKTENPNKLTTYIYSGEEVIAEYENIFLARSYLTGPSIDRPIALIDDTQYYYFHFDWRSNVKELSDNTGNIAESYSYTTFGETTIKNASGTTLSQSTVDNPYGFTGRRLDPETGLYHYRNRIYSPELGRFLQKDPAGFVDGLNIYAYVKNNPLKSYDPYGLCERNFASFSIYSVGEVRNGPGQCITEESIKFWDPTGPYMPDGIHGNPDWVMDQEEIEAANRIERKFGPDSIYRQDRYYTVNLARNGDNAWASMKDYNSTVQKENFDISLITEEEAMLMAMFGVGKLPTFHRYSSTNIWRQRMFVDYVTTGEVNDPEFKRQLRLFSFNKDESLNFLKKKLLIADASSSNALVSEILNKANIDVEIATPSDLFENWVDEHVKYVKKKAKQNLIMGAIVSAITMIVAPGVGQLAAGLISGTGTAATVGGAVLYSAGYAATQTAVSAVGNEIVNGSTGSLGEQFLTNFGTSLINPVGNQSGGFSMAKVASNALGSAITSGVTTAIDGGDLDEVLENSFKSGLVSAATSTFTQFIGPGSAENYDSVLEYVGNSITSGVIKGTIQGGITTAIYGGDWEDNVLQGVITQGIGGVVEGFSGASTILEKGTQISNIDPESKYTEQEIFDKAAMADTTYYDHGNVNPDSIPDGWRVVEGSDLPLGLTQDMFQNDKSGFYSHLFQNENTGEYVLGFRGTTDWQDWKNNIGQGLFGRSAQYRQALELTNDVSDAVNGNLSLVGHSLGGGLASAGALVNNLQALTFHSAGIKARTVGGRSVLNNASHLIESHVVFGEALTWVQENLFFTAWAMPNAVGGRFTYQPTSNVGRIKLHGMSSFIDSYRAHIQQPRSGP